LHASYAQTDVEALHAQFDRVVDALAEQGDEWERRPPARSNSTSSSEARPSMTATDGDVTTLDFQRSVKTCLTVKGALTQTFAALTTGSQR